MIADRNIRRELISVLVLVLVLSGWTSAQSSTAPAEDPSTPPPAHHKYWEKDPIALRQEVDTFTSLEDGQPAGPGDWELELDSGWATRSHYSDPILLTPTLKYTPHRYTEAPAPLLEDMQLRIRMPLELGNGRVDSQGDLHLGFQERWIVEHDGIPSYSTLGEVRVPNGPHSSGVDGRLTAILAKNLGPGAILWNGWVESANGARSAREGFGVEDNERFLDDLLDRDDDLRHFRWGTRIGYKWQISDRFALLADYVHQSSQVTGHANQNVLELGAMWRTAHHLSFGPGLFFGLDRHAETPHFGAGLRFIYLFNGRDPPP